MTKNGHIYAPVGVNEVAEILGVNSYDVGELCTSERINPYSLIRPMPCDVPWIEVKDMKVQHIGDIQPSNENYAWERKQWGYQVPYVKSVSLIEEIKDIAWYRPGADEKHYKTLSHFDGYRHDVEPTFLWAVGDVKQGDEIIVMLAFGDMQPDIVSSSGKANPGGVVSVLEVFGDNPFYYGVQLKWHSGIRYAYGGPVIPGQTTSGVVYTGETARANTQYEITPFICNMNPIGHETTGMQVFNLKFAPNFVSSKTIVVPELVSGASIRALTTAEDGHILTWELHLFNEFPYAMQVSNLMLNIVEQGTTSDFPMRYTLPIEGTYRVEAQGNAVFTINRPIPFRGGVASISATIVASGTLTRVPSGAVVQFSSNIMIMENPRYIIKG